MKRWDEIIKEKNVLITFAATYFHFAFLHEHLAPQPFKLLQLHLTSSDTEPLQKLKVLRFLCYWRVWMPCHVQVTSGYDFQASHAVFFPSPKKAEVVSQTVK
jgi:hypothetical protein